MLIYGHFTKTANQKVALVAAILSSKVYLEYISKNNFQYQILKVLLQMSSEQAARCKCKTYSIFFFCIEDYTVKHMEAHRTNQLTTKRKKNQPKPKKTPFLRILRLQDCSKDSRF